MTSKKRESEVDAYVYVKQELKVQGWDTRNPSRTPSGQVYTQNQCLENEEIKRLWGGKHPEYTVVARHNDFWVIETKNNIKKIDEAVEESQHYYAESLNRSTSIRSLLATGIAGNDSEGYIIRNYYLMDGKWELISINGKDMTGLLSPSLCERLLTENTNDLKDIPVDLALFKKKADNINEILHAGAININDRARVMAALLLSTLQGGNLDFSVSPSLLIKEINARAESALEAQGKKEFFEYVKLSLPTSPDNHKKYRKALVETLTELYALNIKSAMNSGTDVLGQFYEAFLKYGNWAEKMGIVMTPRHITKFAAEALDIGPNDIVLDPTCGTGGFLVAALDHVKSKATQAQFIKFKKYGIFGIDQQASLAALAIVNMIFRGDGKDNIIEGDCFSKWLIRNDEHGNITAQYSNENPDEKQLGEGKRENEDYNSDWHVVTKVLMNPSFATKKNDTLEYKFIQHALTQLENGNLLFSILPMATMFESGEEYLWRKDKLLKENSLLSVITFPPDLFYPVGVHTLGIIVRKGIPHDKQQKVLWVRISKDGYTKTKGRRLPNKKEPDQLTRILPLVKGFLVNGSLQKESEPELYKVAPIDYTDPSLELVPEAYLDAEAPTSEDVLNGIEKLVRENVAFLIKYGKEKDYNVKN